MRETFSFFFFQTIKPHVEAEEKQTESRTVTPPAAPKPKREENPQVSKHIQSFLDRRNYLSFRKHFFPPLFP